MSEIQRLSIIKIAPSTAAVLPTSDGDLCLYDDHLSAIAALQAEREWRPIAEAPIDGTKVLISGLEYNQGPARWYAYAGCFDGVWKTNEDDDDNYFPPSHFIPIPAFPAPPTTEGGES